jgi:hypothetical protein
MLLDVSIGSRKDLGLEGKNEEVRQLIRSTLRTKANGW